MKWHKESLLIGLIFSNIFFCVGQQSPPYKSISIYEIGDTVTNCDINMKNLLRNWVPEKIANANEYEFLKWSFVETISDSSRYVYYRNYFSTDEPVYSSKKGKSGSSHSENKYYEYDSLWVYPGFLHSEFYDPRGLPDKIREIFSEDFRMKAIDIASKELNIDTMQLLYYSYRTIDTVWNTVWTTNKEDTIKRTKSRIAGAGQSVSVGGGVIVSVDATKAISWSKTFIDIWSPDSLSQNYIDVYITHKKSPDDLSIEETRELTLEDLLFQRIILQMQFNEQVKIGDKVFLIKFKHKEKLYNNLIICSSKTNKVVWDYVFKNILLKVYK